MQNSASDKLALDVAKAACDDALDYYNKPDDVPIWRWTTRRTRTAPERRWTIPVRQTYLCATGRGPHLWGWSNGIERSEITEQKQLMADIYVESGVTPDSPWFEFIDELVPGDTPDFTAIDDSLH